MSVDGVFCVWIMSYVCRWCVYVWIMSYVCRWCVLCVDNELCL